MSRLDVCILLYHSLGNFGTDKYQTSETMLTCVSKDWWVDSHLCELTPAVDLWSLVTSSQLGSIQGQVSS